MVLRTGSGQLGSPTERQPIWSTISEWILIFESSR